MRSPQALWIGLGLCVAAVGCGGGGGEPLLSGSAIGEYEGEAFTATAGFATMHGDVPMIGVGDADLDCGSADQDDPPSGRFAAIYPPSFDVGSYTQVSIEIFQNVDGSFGTFGTNGAELTIDAATADSISVEVAFDYTDEDDGAHFALAGTFEVLRCD